MDKVLILEETVTNSQAHAPLANHPDDSYLIFLAGSDRQMRSRLSSTLSQNMKLDTSQGCFKLPSATALLAKNSRPLPLVFWINDKGRNACMIWTQKESRLRVLVEDSR